MTSFGRTSYLWALNKYEHFKHFERPTEKNNTTVFVLFLCRACCALWMMWRDNTIVN